MSSSSSQNNRSSSPSKRRRVGEDGEQKGTPDASSREGHRDTQGGQHELPYSLNKKIRESAVPPKNSIGSEEATPREGAPYSAMATPMDESSHDDGAPPPVVKHAVMPPSVSSSNAMANADVATPRDYGFSSSARSTSSAPPAAGVTPSAVATPPASSSGPFGHLSSLTNVSFDEWKVGPRYRIIKQLGHGSYGEVVEAHDNEKDEKVAIKCIKNVFDQYVDTKRILREVHILSHLNHENVIKLLDIVTPDGDDFNEIYLVFEFVDTDLHKLISSPQYLTVDHVRTFLYQMLCALKYIHSAHVIHRDIKPANILLNEDCGLKICDFGLARVFPTHGDELEERRNKDPSSNSSSSSTSTSKSGKDDTSSATANAKTMTRARSESTEAEEMPSSSSSNKKTVDDEPKRLTRQLTKHVITRWYRPPELILLQEYTKAVDMWSVGCIFAELLSMQKGSIKSFKDRAPLFPGKSCFPLSADNAKTYKDRLDQLNVIFGIIGTPSEDDIVHLGDVRHYLKGLVKKEKRDFQLLFKAAPQQAIDLLDKMLVFNPKKRISVNDAIEHPFLQPVRTKSAEVEASQDLISKLDVADMDREELRGKLLDEIAKYRKQQ